LPYENTEILLSQNESILRRKVADEMYTQFQKIKNEEAKGPTVEEVDKITQDYEKKLKGQNDQSKKFYQFWNY